MNVTEVNGFRLLPPRPDVCQECAKDHPENYPHNQQSLYYHFKFKAEHGRCPTWHDALRHCDPALKADWLRILKEVHGIDPGVDPEAVS